MKFKNLTLAGAVLGSGMSLAHADPAYMYRGWCRQGECYQFSIDKSEVVGKDKSGSLLKLRSEEIIDGVMHRHEDWYAFCSLTHPFIFQYNKLDKKWITEAIVPIEGQVVGAVIDSDFMYFAACHHLDLGRASDGINTVVQAGKKYKYSPAGDNTLENFSNPLKILNHYDW